MLRRGLVVRATGAAVIAAVVATIAVQAATASSAGRVPLAGTATPSSVRSDQVSSVSGSSAVNFQLVLSLRNPSGAQALVQAVSTPGSSSFRHYLTASQWEAQFSPTAADVAKAEAWLRSQGFSVGAVSKDRITIAASGTASQVESAFATGLATYKVHGHNLRMATKNLSVPTSLSGIVVGAIGVNQTVATTAAASSSERGLSSSVSSTASSNGGFPPAPPAFLPAPPCSNYYGQKTTDTRYNRDGYPSTVPDEVCGYKPGQYRSAYDLNNGYTGKGVTVAIIDAYGSSTIAQDATRYFNQNDPGNPFSRADFTQMDAMPFDDESVCGASGWAVEQAIDVESVHSTAPNAHILYVGAQDCENGLFTAEQNVIDNGLANVVTNSWADTGGDLLDDASTKTAYDDLFMLADSTGMTIQYSSGDYLDNFFLFGFSAANYPSSSPFITSVGGTSLEVGSGGQRIGELGWDVGESHLCTSNLVGIICTKSQLGKWLPATVDSGSGGYTSYYYTQPWYQAPVVPSSLALRNEPIFGPTPLRVVPDISADADPSTGFLIGLHQTLANGTDEYTQTRYGGTSLASPLLAGIVADADQQAGVAVGFINPTIYRFANYPAAIYDVVPPQSKVGMYRVDYAGANGLGYPTTGTEQTYRELLWRGTETYCDGTGNCASRQEPLTTAPGYDSLTGLGSPGPDFVDFLAFP